MNIFSALYAVNFYAPHKKSRLMLNFTPSFVQIRNKKLLLSKEFKRQSYCIVVVSTVKLGNKELFDKEQIGIKEPFPVTKCQFTS